MKVIIDEGRKKVLLLLTKLADFDNRVLERIFPFYKSKPEIDQIDSELHPLIRDMWDNSYRTFTCCSGHGKTMGFVLFLPLGKRRLRGVHWEPNENIPQNVAELKGILKAELILAKDEGIKAWLNQNI